ncbi:uncharacterized protein LOC136074129 [Hydra vulgaris]|uniref:Uncharacterized protein LOC136074129 n=1 Tax=Hydra vulgaris TaxID=6087 RepID=A0ABM4B169_HYDVU
MIEEEVEKEVEQIEKEIHEIIKEMDWEQYILDTTKNKMNNNDDFDEMFHGFGDVLEEPENMEVEDITFNDIFKGQDIEDIETNIILILILLFQLIKKMEDNTYPCCFCDKEFTAEEFMKHQIDCSTEQYSHECFTYYYEHSVNCFQSYKEQQNQYFKQMIQDEMKKLHYLNVFINQIMNGMKNHQVILTKQINNSKEKDQEIKNLKEENVKLYQTQEETNKEMSELKNLFYDNMMVLANQQDTEHLNQEITKLNQTVEENSTEFLALKKINSTNERSESNTTHL